MYGCSLAADTAARRAEIQVIGPELLDVLQDRLEVVDRLRIALRLPRHAVGAQKIRHFLGVVVIEEAHAATVEAGVADHFGFCCSVHS